MTQKFLGQLQESRYGDRSDAIFLIGLRIAPFFVQQAGFDFSW
jgi:hypothetical protein